MSKQYKTWELVKMWEEGERGNYKNNHDIIIRLSDLGIVLAECEQTHFITLTNLPMDETWTKVQEPVDFIKAIEAYYNGETIICKWIGEDSRPEESEYIPKDFRLKIMEDICGSSISAFEILHGTWYIKEGQY